MSPEYSSSYERANRRFVWPLPSVRPSIHPRRFRFPARINGFGRFWRSKLRVQITEYARNCDIQTRSETTLEKIQGFHLDFSLRLTRQEKWKSSRLRATPAAAGPSSFPNSDSFKLPFCCYAPKTKRGKGKVEIVTRCSPPSLLFFFSKMSPSFSREAEEFFR